MVRSSLGTLTLATPGSPKLIGQSSGFIARTRESLAQERAGNRAADRGGRGGVETGNVFEPDVHLDPAGRRDLEDERVEILGGHVLGEGRERFGNPDQPATFPQRKVLWRTRWIEGQTQHGPEGRLGGPGHVRDRPHHDRQSLGRIRRDEI